MILSWWTCSGWCWVYVLVLVLVGLSCDSPGLLSDSSWFSDELLPLLDTDSPHRKLTSAGGNSKHTDTDCFGLLWPALACFGLLWSALVCFGLLCVFDLVCWCGFDLVYGSYLCSIHEIHESFFLTNSVKDLVIMDNLQINLNGTENETNAKFHHNKQKWNRSFGLHSLTFTIYLYLLSFTSNYQ